MADSGRIVIIGLDGVPCGLLQDFADSGVMPNTARLMKEGLFRRMESSIPEISSVAWSSMITGKGPGEHNIYGFMDLSPDSYRMRFPNFTDLGAKPFWQEWPGRSAIINVPSTYPVRPMNGVHISGFVSIDFDKSVYPESLAGELRELDYRLDVEAQKAAESMPDFIRDLEETLEARIAAYQQLWKKEDWDTFMLVFTGTDRLMHFLWDACEDKSHKYHGSFLQHFTRIDQAIGEIAGKLSPDDVLVMLSDHGFERLDSEVYVAAVLRNEGLLQFKSGEKPGLESIDYQTKAFVLDPGRIYLNQQGKYPSGSVSETEAEDILGRIEEIFRGLRIDGREVIRDIYRRNDIYSGPYLANAPDLVLVAKEGFNLKGSLRADKVADKGIFTGKHTQDTAFLLIHGLEDQAIVPEIPTVRDVRWIMEKHRGA